MLKTLKGREAIVTFGRQTEVWLPDGRDEACSIIGKFTQGSLADGKRLTRRLIIDRGSSISWSVTHGKVAPWWEHPKSALWDISSRIMMVPSPLRASMLAYTHINLLSMLSRFTPDEAVRVATDSIYVRKSALKRID